MIKKEPVNKETVSIGAEQIADLKELFPQVVSEGKIDFDKLRESLGDEVDSRPERYSFTWAGKRDAIRILQSPSRATLVPAKKESIAFDKTGNIFIEGDNLEVLKLLYKSYFGAVKMIYIDPPYNTGNDFVYPDNFVDPLDTYLKLTGQKTAEGNLLTSNPETSGRYHSAWLSMMYPRLFIARQLLRDDGVIFVSIDDHEVHNLRMVMHEIFGEENFVANVIWQKKYTRSNDAKWFSDNHDHILVFARSKEQLQLKLQPRTDDQKAAYSNPDSHPKGPWKATPLHAKSGNTQGFKYKFKNGITWSPPIGTYPRYSSETMKRLDANDKIWFGTEGKSMPSKKSFLENVKKGITPITIWLHGEVGHNHEANNELKVLKLEGLFDNPKPTRLIRRMIELTTAPNDNDLILDFFAGSCTTSQTVLDVNRECNSNRRFIAVQLPEPTENANYPTIAEIGKERIRRCIAKLKMKTEGKLDLNNGDAAEDLGFKVFKLAESNYKPWTGVEGKDAQAYATQMAAFTDPFVTGWNPENVIWEVAIKEGYGLNSEVIHMTGIKENVVFHVTDPDKGQSFRICLDEVLKPVAIRALALGKNDLFICRDKAMTDELAANLALQCRFKTI